MASADFSRSFLCFSPSGSIGQTSVNSTASIGFVTEPCSGNEMSNLSAAAIRKLEGFLGFLLAGFQYEPVSSKLFFGRVTATYINLSSSFNRCARISTLKSSMLFFTSG